MDDNFPEKVDNYFKILEENIDILANLAIDLEDEKEDELVPDMELYQLFDMTEDVSESSKIKRAEFNLAQRQVDYSL
jgi:hypothetical protein